MALGYGAAMKNKTSKAPKTRDEVRRDRLKQALKANLARRKSQVKSRAGKEG